MGRIIKQSVPIVTTEPYVFVTNVTELYAAISAATAGTIIKMEPGTYTLSLAGGDYLSLPNGVTLEGAGQNQTIITDDGTLSDTLIKIEGTAGSSYNVDPVSTRI